MGLPLCYRLFENSTRLERLINWLHSDPVRAAKLRILIIDDEADQAGINTAKMSEYLTEEDVVERTAINQYLVNLANGKMQMERKPMLRFKL